ncbi:MAG: glutamate mutase L [Motilibacteraceae bacterium]
MGTVCCVDVGSTFTKAALVDLADGTLLGTATHPTTSSTDVLIGVDACRAQLGAGDDVPVLACSSAGGGLRLAVVGYERVVTAEAGYRVGLSAGARVVHVSAGELDREGVEALLADRPDVVLLVGGTDGGNAEVLLHNARRLAASRLTVPVVVAGNVDARDEVVAVLEGRRKKVIACANVLPEIGVLEPRPAREAIREVFIRHVIGGKGLSRGPRFAAMVRAATPDAVLAGVELLADGAGDVPGVGDVLVVDVGGATTDVYSVVAPEEEAELHAEVSGTMWRARTVEGDLGMRWNAPGLVQAAVGERLLTDPSAEKSLQETAGALHADVSYVPSDDAGRDVDARLAELAVTVALRRHARPGGRDLRRVRLVVGSGGVLRHGSERLRAQVLAPATSDRAGGWKLPEHADVVVDTRYVLAAAGLLAAEHPVAAARLVRSLLS